MNSLDLTGRNRDSHRRLWRHGLATAQAIATAGGNVVLTSWSQESADAVAAQVGANAFGVGANAVDEAAAARCVDLIIHIQDERPHLLPLHRHWLHHPP
jgi:NAD(P)-dependent dehydrogenase (short-subunit alcohol dehydrogenase family)